MKKNLMFNLQKLKSIPVIYFIVIGLGLKFILAYGFIYLMRLYGDARFYQGYFNFESIGEEFFVAVILAPVLETYLVFHLPFTKLKKSIRPFGIIVLTSVLFGLLHHYNEYYQLYAFYSGLLFASIYYIKLQSGYSFCIVTAIHMLYNFWVLVSNYF